jgi:LysM repeat protein
MQQLQRASIISSGRFQRSRGSLSVGLAIVLLLLAACSRQADGPFQPVDGSTPTLPSTTVSQVVDGTLPPLPTEDTDPEDDPASTAVIEPPTTEEADAVSVFTLDPNAPPIFTLAASATWTPDPDGDAGTEEATATLSGDFITPGAPQGPVDLTGGSTSGISGTTEVGTGDLLPTPTDFLNFGGTDVAEVDEECIYVVQRGDSLFGISLELEVSLDDLRAINPEVQDTDVIQVDQELIIPNCDEDFVVPTEDPDAEADTPAGGATLLPTPGGRATESTEDETGRTHTVAAGETLFIIAQEYGVTIDAIVEANNLSNPNRLDIGQLLLIPDSE